MKKIHPAYFFHLFLRSLLATLLVLTTTIPIWLIGRQVLGEAVIALLYLIPVSWSAFRWGRLPGISAALVASLTFNFLFIPPFFTFAIARLEGWLVLVIFVSVAILVVEQIQSSRMKAREATFMYELCAALAGARTPEAAARILARQIQQLFQASMVWVTYRDATSGTRVIVSQPEGVEKIGRPDRVLPVLNSWGLVGEIQIWRGLFSELPAEDGALFRNFTHQAGTAFERTRSTDLDKSTVLG
jgi:K+-sensing histidine kinase KdpD